MNWTPVNSSQVIGQSYDQAKEQLYLRFKNNRVYRYMPVKPQTMKDFLNSKSKGSFVHKVLGQDPTIMTTEIKRKNDRD